MQIDNIISKTNSLEYRLDFDFIYIQKKNQYFRNSS